jgi:hypothetical protein
VTEPLMRPPLSHCAAPIAEEFPAKRDSGWRVTRAAARPKEPATPRVLPRCCGWRVARDRATRHSSVSPLPPWRDARGAPAAAAAHRRDGDQRPAAAGLAPACAVDDGGTLRYTPAVSPPPTPLE